MKDSVTVLTTLHPRHLACKTFWHDGDEDRTEPYNCGTHFHIREAAVSDIHHLSRLLRDLEGNARSLVIRGNRKAGRADETSVVTRTLHGPDACFGPAPHRWLCIDLDDLPLPVEMSDFHARAEDVVRHAIAQLPPEFREVACHWQFSSSMGVKKGVRLHLWFWLNRPVSDAEAKVWLRRASTKVDMALYNPVQPHYTAAPRFVGGRVDPVQRRSGMLSSDGGGLVVAVPDDLEVDQTERAAASPRTSNRGTASGQDVVRDPATGLVIDGRERWLFLMAAEACRNLTKGQRGHVPTIEEITNETWRLFRETADLTDGRWTQEKAREKARRLHARLCEGWTPNAKQDEHRLVPDVKPYFQLNPVSLEEGWAILDQEVSGFMNDVQQGERPRKAIDVTMGTGKTAVTWPTFSPPLTGKEGCRRDCRADVG